MFKKMSYYVAGLALVVAAFATSTAFAEEFASIEDARYGNSTTRECDRNPTGSSLCRARNFCDLNPHHSKCENYCSTNPFDPKCGGTSHGGGWDYRRGRR